MYIYIYIYDDDPNRNALGLTTGSQMSSFNHKFIIAGRQRSSQCQVISYCQRHGCLYLPFRDLLHNVETPPLTIHLDRQHLSWYRSINQSGSGNITSLFTFLQTKSKALQAQNMYVTYISLLLQHHDPTLFPQFC